MPEWETKTVQVAMDAGAGAYRIVCKGDQSLMKKSPC